MSVQYPCGQLGKTIRDKLSGRSLIDAETVNQHEMSLNNTHVNMSAENAETTSENNTLSLINATASPVPPVVINSTLQPTPDGGIPTWKFYPTLPTIKADTSIDERIVGGNEATRGEIPWQVRANRQMTIIWHVSGITDVV